MNERKTFSPPWTFSNCFNLNWIHPRVSLRSIHADIGPELIRFQVEFYPVPYLAHRLLSIRSKKKSRSKGNSPWNEDRRELVVETIIDLIIRWHCLLFEVLLWRYQRYGFDDERGLFRDFFREILSLKLRFEFFFFVFILSSYLD